MLEGWQTCWETVQDHFMGRNWTILAWTFSGKCPCPDLPPNRTKLAQICFQRVGNCPQSGFDPLVAPQILVWWVLESMPIKLKSRRTQRLGPLRPLTEAPQSALSHPTFVTYARTIDLVCWRAGEHVGRQFSTISWAEIGPS